jgi:hypothetical protein
VVVALNRSAFPIIRLVTAILLSLLTQGCCYFFPCDYFLTADGIVLGSQNQPLANAEIETKPFTDPKDATYNKHFEGRSGADGCFRLDGFSVPPQQWVPLAVVAPGYKSVVEQVPGTGSLHMIVTLVPQSSDKDDSKVLLVPAESTSTPFPQCKVPCKTKCSN